MADEISRATPGGNRHTIRVVVMSFVQIYEQAVSVVGIA